MKKQKTKDPTPPKESLSKKKNGLGSTAPKVAVTASRKHKSGRKSDLWTLKTVAEKFDLSEKSARNLLGKVPVVGKNGLANLYDSKLVIEAATKMAGNRSEKTEDREELEKEKLRQQIRRLVVDADIAEGRVVERNEVLQTFVAMHVQVRAQLVEMVEKMPPVLSGLTPAAMEVRLRDHIENILEKFREHKWGKES